VGPEALFQQVQSEEQTTMLIGGKAAGLAWRPSGTVKNVAVKLPAKLLANRVEETF
jgi:hypothetical protein